MFAVLNTVKRNGNYGQRFVHRTPDYTYVKEGKRKSRWYREQLAVSQEKMRDYPQLMHRYLSTTAVMKSKGKVPFVHALPLYYRVPRLFLETFCKRDSAKSQYFRYLRFPSMQYAVGREELVKRIEAYVEKHGSTGWTPGDWNTQVSRMDADPTFRPFMVSLSYSMMDFTKSESAFDFLFNRPVYSGADREKPMMENWISSTLKTYGLKDRVSEVQERLSPFYDSYCQLDVNSLFVIGIPEEKLGDFVFDAKSFGIPTGEDMVQVSKAPWNSPRAFSSEEGGLQARLLMYKETMNPASGIEVVDVDDEEEVQKFCEGVAITPPSEVPEFSHLFSSTPTAAERKHRETQQLLDQQVKQIASTL